MTPPGMAVWLIDLFATPTQAETILGDLSEEFASVAAAKGHVAARRWYWRQAMRTTGHLVLGQVRQAPWWFVTLAIAGAYLPGITGRVVQQGVIAVHYRWQVYSYIDAYSFWLIYAVLIRSLMVPMFSGWAIAKAMRHRAVTSASVLGVSSLVAALVLTWPLIRHWPPQPFLVRAQRSFLIEAWSLTGLSFIAILAGGVLARKQEVIGDR